MTYRISFRVARSAPQKQESGAAKATSSDSLLFQAHCAAPGIAADSGSLFRRPPLDGRIQNYDSPYHVLSTDVKTELCSPSMRSATPHGQCGIPVPSLDPSGRTARQVPRGELSSSISYTGGECQGEVSAACKSEWHPPQASTAIRTSLGSGSGRATSSIESGRLNSWITAALMRRAIV